MVKKLVVGMIAVMCILTIYLSWQQGMIRPQTGIKGGPKVGVIRIEGVISSSSGGDVWGVSGSSLEEVRKALKEAAKREDIKAVVIRLDSPGGTVPAAQEISREIGMIKRKNKPVVASMGDVAASGAYWVACSCDEIMANPGTITGSIGVIMELMNYQELLNKLGVRTEVIKSGEFKDIGSATREMNSYEKKLLEEMVRDSYEQFALAVKEGRKGKLDENKLNEILDGRVFTGRQAQKVGLVDKIGGLSDAVALAAKMAGIKGEPQIEELNAVDPLTKMLKSFSLYNSALLPVLKSVY